MAKVQRCAAKGCQTFTLRRYCDQHHVELGRHLYDTRRWRRARAVFLRGHPLCECDACEAGELRVLPATVVDHVVAHKGNEMLFWDVGNWRAMSKVCHDEKTAHMDGGGGNERKAVLPIKGCDVDGRPLDPAHPWNQGAFK